LLGEPSNHDNTFVEDSNSSNERLSLCHLHLAHLDHIDRYHIDKRGPEQVDAVMLKIRTALESKLGAELR
jgi:hypothetical protein